MPRTQPTGRQIADGTVQRDDLDVATVGQAVVRKLIQGTNITLTSTGSDAGTGDVTIAATGSGSPGGADTQIQYNDAGGFGGDSLLVWNETNKSLGVGVATAPSLGPGAFFGESNSGSLWVASSGMTSVVVKGTSGACIQFLNSSDAATADFGVYGTSVYFVNRAGGNMYFDHVTGNFHAIVIDSGGRVSIGQNAATPSAALDVQGTTRGFLPPRMTTTERDAIAASATGLVVFNTTTDRLNLKQTGGWVELVVPSQLPTVGTTAPSSPAVGALWVDTN